MPTLTASVGAGQENTRHDTALVQAMLKLIMDSGGRPYLAGSIDGAYGTQTQTAIDAFQDAHGSDATPIRAGIITPAGATLRTLGRLLPANRAALHVLPGQKVVYVAGSAADANALATAMAGDAQFRQGFRNKVSQLITAMYREHGVVLRLTPSGGRRDFAAQAAVNPRSTYAGPGESNHQYGNAVDIGFDGLVWLRSNAVPVTDNHWLGSLARISNAAAQAFWDARDAIALAAPLSLHNLRPMELIHLQEFSGANVSMTRSLAAHLTRAGNWRWRTGRYDRVNRDMYYNCDLGGTTGRFVEVGNANEIWDGNASVTAAEVRRAGWVRPAADANADPARPPVPAAQPRGEDGPPPVAGAPRQNAPANGVARVAATGPITAADLRAVRTALQEEFQAADRAWQDWEPVAR